MASQTSSALAPPVLQLIATSAPALASASATARPMPRELPVTNALFPSRLRLGTSHSPLVWVAGTSRVALWVVMISELLFVFERMGGDRGPPFGGAAPC